MLHVIVGPPCAGKSTYVREHAAEGDVAVDFDALCKALGSRSDHSAPDGIRGAAFKARSAVIDHCIETGQEAWVIHTSPGAEAMARYEACGAEVVTLDTPMDECLRRCEADGRPEGTEQVIRDWFAAHGEKGIKMSQFKQCACQLKAAPDGGKGIVEAYAATFDRDPDAYGDVIAKGAFAETLAAYEAEQRRIPVLFDHRTDDPLLNIGIVEEAREDERGLFVRMLLDVDKNERAAYAYELVKEGRLDRMSFAYGVRDEARVTLEDGTRCNELRKLDLYEVSLVPIPANQHAVVLGAKAGRVLSRKNADELRRVAGLADEIREAIDGLLSQLDDGGGEDADRGATEAKAGASAEEPTERKAAATELLARMERLIGEHHDSL